MTVHLHHATRTDVLADALADVLAAPVPDPFAEEVVVVPAKGVERWLTQRLSHRLGSGARGGDGVCAGVRFLSPRSLVALLTGTEREDHWDPDRFVWPLLAVVDDSLGEQWCATLAAHLGHRVEGERGELRRDRRYSVVRRIAGLFAAYAVQRPDLLRDWRQGRDTDGAGVPLPDDLTWQPSLWRRLLSRVDAPPPDERHRRTLEAIRAGAPLALPDRLSMFGHTRLPVTELELLRALGEVREVHLWLPQPSPAVWEQLRETCADGPVRRRADTSAALVRHRLLASLGRDARELQRSLTLLGEVDEQPDPGTAPRPPPATLLGRLQQQLRDDAPIAVGGARVRSDRSVQVHSCHGPARQVEVLREVLVGLLQDREDLEPRDVLVLCPDVEAYAPLFSAGFGLADAVGSEGHPGHRLRLRLADRGPARVNPLLALAQRLVAVAAGRATASEVLDLASSDPVRERFGWDDDELAEIGGWVDRAGIRWGLSPALRAPFGLPDFEENTWRTGLDRILLGVAAAEDGVVLGDRLPLDDVGSTGVDLAGRLAELLARLEAAVSALHEARTVHDWVVALRAGVAGLGAAPRREGWQQAQFDRELDLLADAARGTTGSAEGELRLSEVRTLLDLRLEPRPTRANFRTGHITVCTMVPMRSVPHRVVCLVGLDDGVFPRNIVTDGDDVLARDPLTGERDARSEDRQLLLDAVLAAEETLVVTYTGASIHNNQPRPPAVPLDELLDTVEAMVPGARAAVVWEHPLQRFDPRNFDPATVAGPMSFDRDAAAAARRIQGPRTRPLAFLAEPLPALGEQDVQLEDLRAFLRHPVAGFLRQRLDVSVPDRHEEPGDSMPLALDPLAEWQIGERLLGRLLGSDVTGTQAQQVLTSELLRGDLPPRRLGERTLSEVCRRVQALQEASRQDREPGVDSVDVTTEVGAGRRLTGVVPDVRGGRIVRVQYARLAPRHRLAAWADLLALSAAYPDQHWTAATYGWFRRYGREGVAWSVLGPVPEAPRVLRELVDLWHRGLREPLPLFARVSPAWADARRTGKDAFGFAEREWQGTDRYPGERADPAHVRVFGHGSELARLLGQPRDDERWSDDEPTRVGQYAARLWAPLLTREARKNL